jgi:hypothetical protein
MADLISGGTFDDGVVAASEVTGLHSVASTGDFNELENKPTPQTAAQLLTAVKTVDGSGSGLDADLLDGLHASSFATSAQGTLASNALPKSGGTMTGTITTNSDIVSTGRDNGVFGVYNSALTDQIWSMGTAYRNHASGTNFGNLYGLAYKHTNNSTGGTMAAGHQMVWCSNGTPKSAMGDNLWTANHLTIGGNVYHNGDTNTYFGFHAADQWRVVTGGAERLEVNNSKITSTEPIYAPSFHGNGSALTGVGGSTSTGAVGTYAFLFEVAGNITPNGTTRAGSGLRYANAISDVNNTGWAGYYTASASGTWRCMGYTGRANASGSNYAYVAGGRTTLWVRIS